MFGPQNIILITIILLGNYSFSACNQAAKIPKNSISIEEYTEAELDRLGITNKDFLSSASKRALAWPKLTNEWFGEFKVSDLKGDLAYEEGVVRRDPSALIREDGLYFVWYSKSTGPSQGFGGDIENEKVFPWDRCDIWYATSKDGITWKEEG